MNPETLNFIKSAIHDGNIIRVFDDTKTVYNIQDNFGTLIKITETIISNKKHVVGRHYQIKIEDDVIEAFCEDKASGHTQIAQQIKSLIQKCSDKLFYQEIRARKKQHLENKIIRSK